MTNARLNTINWNEVFEYRDGELYWKIQTRRSNIGDKASTKSVKKDKHYIRSIVRYKNIVYVTARVIYEMFHGNITDPSLVVDHIDGLPDNNRIENLRLVTCQQNNLNRKCHREGKLPGCCFRKDRNNWRAYVTIRNDRKRYLGSYKTQEEAHQAHLRGLEVLEEDLRKGKILPNGKPKYWRAKKIR